MWGVVKLAAGRSVRRGGAKPFRSSRLCRRLRPEATAGLCVCMCMCVCVGVRVLPIEAIYTDSADTVIRCVRKSACVFGTATLLVRSVNQQDLSSIYFFLSDAFCYKVAGWKALEAWSSFRKTLPAVTVHQCD